MKVAIRSFKAIQLSLFL